MGGLGPGIGGLEYVVIAAVALIVLGPERLPGVLRQVGRWVAKARGMANEFRASFDEMARQSELDELRKEVEALRQGQGFAGAGMVRLGAEADAAFKDIKTQLEKPVETTPQPMVLDQPEFPEPVMTPLAPAASPPVPKPSKPRAPRKAATGKAASPKSKAKTLDAPTPKARAAAKPAARKAAPRKSKTDKAGAAS